MTISRSIHVFTNDPISSFLWLSNIPLYTYIYIYHILFIHFSVDGHSGCFHVLPIVNTTHSNICLFTGLYVSTSDLSLDLKLIFMTRLEIATYLLFRSSSQVYLLLHNSCEYATLPICPQSILRSKSINRYLNHKDRVTNTRFVSEQSWFGGQG